MADVSAANTTLYDATPQINLPHSSVQGGTVHQIVDTVETSTIMSVNDNALICRLPVDAVLLSFQLAIDDMGTTGDVEVGFYRTVDDGGAVLDADALVNLIDVNAAVTALTEYRFDTLGIETAQQPVWDLATVAARPEYEFIDVKVNFTEASTVAGTISVIALYSM